MKEKHIKKKSLTDWDRVDAMPDEEIDVSDIPPLDASFFENATLRMPENKTLITLRVDTDVLNWFKSQGKGYQTKINTILKTYMESGRGLI